MRRTGQRISERCGQSFSGSRAFAIATYAFSVAFRSRAAAAVYPYTTSSVTQAESPEDASRRLLIFRRTSPTPPNSLIHGANRSARLNAGATADSVGPPREGTGPADEMGAATRQANRLRPADRVSDHERPAHPQRVEHRGDPVRLRGQGIVGVRGAPRGSDAEGLDHDRPVPRRVEERDQLAEPELGPE